MKMKDEPDHRPRLDDKPSETGDTGPLQQKIEQLVKSQPYAVLCTQGEGQPYGSLVAFAFSDDLTSVVFATTVATRKYKLLLECDRVALLVDNRPDHVDDMMQVEAITVTGRAEEVKTETHFDRCAGLLLARHPYLKSFVESESSAVFEIRVNRILHVTRFQEVNQWVPVKR
jgi:nitroimidazol reductase NimA-like FMN-containing flavoprotein (pyridoxamine 5'-phosphate oxidase superfamily)